MKNVENKFTLVFLVILIVINIVYLYNNKSNKFKNITEVKYIEKPSVETPKVTTLVRNEKETIKKNEEMLYQLPVEIYGNVVIDINKKSRNPFLEQIFGIYTGLPIEKEIIIAEFKLSSGESIYEIRPIVENEEIMLTTFYITINTIDNTINSYRSIGPAGTYEEVLLQYEGAISQTTQRYKLLLQQRYTSYFKNEWGDLFIAKLEKNKDKEWEYRTHFIVGTK